MTARLFHNAAAYTILAILIANTLALAGVLPGVAFGTQMMILFGLTLHIPLLFLEPNYFGDVSRPVLALFAVIFTFILMGYVQYAFGFRDISWMPGTVSRFSTYEYLLQSCFYAIFFWLCVKAFSHRRAAQKSMLVISLLLFVVTSVGLLQRLSGTTKIFWYYETNLQTTFGPFIYENNFGAFICLTLPLTGALAAYRAASSWRGFPRFTWVNLLDASSNVVNSGALFFVFLLGFGIAATFISNARAAAISLLLTFTAFLIIGLWRKRSSKTAISLAAITIAGLAAIITAYPGRWIELYDPTLLGQGLILRTKLYGDSLRIFFDHLPFGIGLGGYRFMAPKYLTVPLEEMGYEHANNDYIELAAETGVAGLAIVLIFFSIFAFAVGRDYSRLKSRFCKALWLQAGLAIASFSFTILSDSHLKLPVIPLFLFMQLAVMLQARAMDRAHSSHLAGQVAIPSLGRAAKISVIFGIICFSALLAGMSNTHRRAEVLLMQSDSLTHLSRAITLEPDNPAGYLQISKLHYDLATSQSRKEVREEHFQKSIAAGKRMVELAPTYAHYWFTLGQFEYLHGEREEGIRALETALEQSPLNRRYAACLLSAYLKEYEKIVSPTKKNEMWRKSQTLFSKIISGKNAPNDSQLRAWMLQYNDSLIRQLRTSVSVPS